MRVKWWRNESLSATFSYTKSLLAKFGINVFESRIIDGTTILLLPDEVKLLYSKAPYLVAMSVTDFSQIKLEDVSGIT